MYTVEALIPGQTKWRFFKKVVGDGFLEDKPDIRFLCLADGTFVHLPYNTTLIFSPEREAQIKKSVEKQVGQNVQWEK